MKRVFQERLSFTGCMVSDTVLIKPYLFSVIILRLRSPFTVEFVFNSEQTLKLFSYIKATMKIELPSYFFTNKIDGVESLSYFKFIRGLSYERSVHKTVH